MKRQTSVRYLLAAVVLAAFTGAAMAAKTDTIQTANGPVDVQAIEHASLMLTWNGKHVLVDPAEPHDGGGQSLYAALPKPDLIFYTHSHGDHFNNEILERIAGPNTQIYAPQEVMPLVPEALKSRVHLMANGDKTTVDGIGVEAVPMYNITPERMKFHAKGRGNGYVLSFGGKRIYVAGDTEETPELAHLPQIDAAFLPMNLPYTESVEAAAQWVKDFRPRAVYPYHFRNGDKPKSDLAAFKKDVGGASEVHLLEWY